MRTLGSLSKHCQARARTSFSRAVRSFLSPMVVSSSGAGGVCWCLDGVRCWMDVVCLMLLGLKCRGRVKEMES
jgi:hypothetical protein